MAIQLIDTVTPDIGLKTVADKLNNNFTDPSHAASRLVGLDKGRVALSGDFVDIDGVTGLTNTGGINVRWSFNPPTLQAGTFTPYTPSFAAGVGLLVDNGSNAAMIALNSNTGRLYTNGKGGSVWQRERDYIATIDVLTTTGQSTSFPMTQKATTDAINGISDERDKTEIHEIGLGLEVIENINTFSFKLNKRDWYRQQAAKELVEVEEDGKVITQEKINDDILNAPLSDFEENDGSLKRDDVYTGFVAQDLKETLEALDLGHLGIVKNYAEEYEGGEDRFYIEHLALLPFLVNSVKQLSARVKELEDAAK